MAGEYINSKAGKKRIKKQWKNREKKDELHTFKDTTKVALLQRKRATFTAYHPHNWFNDIFFQIDSI
ncbi:hypothetical protein [Prevotella intermedia]|uniref:Uncharacterized protein n=1 Tax=Prevotella intermedia TaxID=28131 RepID=A0A2G8I733_PREIN|nr:hypothetical protein [Prevotella intermedia]PIK19259.1 hypothetical protein CTI18_09870 [Prevotella intermedia]